MFTACGEPDATVITPVLTATPETFEEGGSTTFTVTVDGEDVTASASITAIEAQTAVTDAVWTSETAGTYTFEAVYKGVKSNVVTVTVEAPEVVAPEVAKIGVSLSGNGETVTRIALRGVSKDGTASPDATEYEIGLVTPAGVVAGAEPANVTAEDGYIELPAQTLTESARVVVTVNDKKMAFPIEDVTELEVNEEYIILVAIPAEKPLDYTDNAMPAFVIAPSDLAESENILYADAMEDCPEGWRLPTYNEGIISLLYVNAIQDHAYRGATYWTSTLYKDDDTNAMGIDYMRKYTLWMPSYGVTVGRCVKSVPAGKKYPYIDTTDPAGPIIVSRDADGGVITASTYDGVDMPVFHDNWTTTPEHEATTLTDMIPHKLQVANADETTGKVIRNELACAEGWRTPTQYELMLVYAVGGGEAEIYDTDPESPFYNAPVTETVLNEIEGFTPFQVDNYWVETAIAGRGGITALVWPFKETAMRGSGTFPGPDTNWVRCVRDVE
jgi:hypothetical protein